MNCAITEARSTSVSLPPCDNYVMKSDSNILAMPETNDYLNLLTHNADEFNQVLEPPRGDFM